MRNLGARSPVRRAMNRALLVPALLVASLVAVALSTSAAAAPRYPWLERAPSSSSSLAQRVPAPAGFTRVPVASGSFGAFLRELPLAPDGTPVRTHAGDPIAAPAYAVVDLDVGARDLMQCADSIIRLRAEHLFSAGRLDEIAFHFTNGDLARFSRWSEGFRPTLQGRTKVVWRKSARPASDHATLRRYLDTVFMWAGTASLARHTPAAEGNVRPGDFFVLGGFPGHAVLVLDVARSAGGETRLLLGQGFMPAQSFHVLRAPDGGAWFPYDGGDLLTPSWPTPFPRTSLRRFVDRR